MLEILQLFRCLVTWPLSTGCHVTNLYLLSLDHSPCRWYWVIGSYFSWAVINAADVAGLSPTGYPSQRVLELSWWSGKFRWHGITICTEGHCWPEVLLHQCLLANLLTENRCGRQLLAMKGVTTEMVGVVILASLRNWSISDLMPALLSVPLPRPALLPGLPMEVLAPVSCRFCWSCNCSYFCPQGGTEGQKWRMNLVGWWQVTLSLPRLDQLHYQKWCHWFATPFLIPGSSAIGEGVVHNLGKDILASL